MDNTNSGSPAAPSRRGCLGPAVGFTAAIRSGQPMNYGDYLASSTFAAIMGQPSCYTDQEVTSEQSSQSGFAYALRAEECRNDMASPVQPGPYSVYPTSKPGVTRLI